DAGIRVRNVPGVQTCALPILLDHHLAAAELLKPRQRLRQHVRLVHGGERAQGRRGRGGPVHRGPLSAFLLRRRGVPLPARARARSEERRGGVGGGGEGRRRQG